MNSLDCQRFCQLKTRRPSVCVSSNVCVCVCLCGQMCYVWVCVAMCFDFGPSSQRAGWARWGSMAFDGHTEPARVRRGATRSRACFNVKTHVFRESCPPRGNRRGGTISAKCCALVRWHTGTLSVRSGISLRIASHALQKNDRPVNTIARVRDAAITFAKWIIKRNFAPPNYIAMRVVRQAPLVLR